jgi:predicted ATPase
MLSLAGKQGAKVPLTMGHLCMGVSLMLTGNLAEGRTHLDQAIELYDPVEYRSQERFLFYIDHRVSALMYRSLAQWALGYPEAALASADRAIGYARDTGGAASLMNSMSVTSLTLLIGGNFALARARSDELIALAEEKGSNYWKLSGLLRRAGLLVLTGRTSDAVSIFASAIPVWRSMGTTIHLPLQLSLWARACAGLGQFDNAWGCIGEAITRVEATKETLFEAEVHRIAGEIALMSPEPDAAKAEASFERALAIAHAQQAKSWELRSAMSMARLWRDQGKRDAARELLAPVYGWFTEGFDTRDLRDAKALLDELAI